MYAAMTKIFVAFATIFALVQQIEANLDVITLNTKSDSWITEASATLVLGDVPNPITGDLALWSAITMDKRDFLQGVTENANPSPYCKNLGKNWCSFAYTLIGNNPIVGKAVSSPPGTRIRTHYKYNTDTTLWDQNLYVDGKLMSNISTSKGQHGVIFYVSLECAAGVCATAPKHSWEDISVILSKPNPSFQHSGSWQYQATGGVMSTPDNGKTWNFTTLEIPNTMVPPG